MCKYYVVAEVLTEGNTLFCVPYDNGWVVDLEM